ncbi:phosphotransferase family protein [Kitasatospora sp. NPDC059088]|uniref:phosphotransferase family protein n=1 Tax=Kitasatospora sp. NPDC059088 TaxID=3346722 RepID=UPI00368A8448
MNVLRATTHAVELHEESVTKTYRNCKRDEPDREWRALRLLSDFAPGLAPAPLTADLGGATPSIVMSRLPGHPLRGSVLTADQLHALAEAITTLHSAVPHDELARLQPAAWDAPGALARLRAMTAGGPGAEDRDVQRALAAGRRWLDGFALPTPPRHDLVLGTADGNLANYLWDQDTGTVHVVDFEDSGTADPAFELAELLEHPSAWVDIDSGTEALPGLLHLRPEQQARLTQFRRLLALIWLLMLLPGQDAAHRNPPGTHLRQAVRVLDRLA